MDCESKKCSTCGKVKPLQAFYLDKTGRQGRRADCKICNRASATARYVDDPEKARARVKAYREANPEKTLAGVAAWRKANPERNQALVRAAGRAYQKAHPDKSCKRSADRRARKLKATPTWADSAAMAEIYAQAQAQTEVTGIEHNVDHWVPLRSKLVSGLHVEFNLRVITKAANLSKGNRTWPDMP